MKVGDWVRLYDGMFAKVTCIHEDTNEIDVDIPYMEEIDDISLTGKHVGDFIQIYDGSWGKIIKIEDGYITVEVNVSDRVKIDLVHKIEIKK